MIDEKEMRRFLTTLANIKNKDEITALSWQKICKNLRKQER